MNVNTKNEHNLPGNMERCNIQGCRKHARVLIAWNRGDEMYCKEHAVRHLLSKRIQYAAIAPETIRCDLQ